MPLPILIVEDDPHIGPAVRAFLTDAGYAADLSANGDHACDAFFAARPPYALVILDLLLPGMGGLDLLKTIRETSDVPALIMTALSDDHHEIGAFDLRADDYITKPFSMQILLRRVEALLRRSGALRAELRAGALSVFPESRAAHWDGAPLSLTTREFEILLLLLRNEGRVLTYQTILDRVWGYDAEGDEATVYTHMKNLRLKIPAPIIKTVRGVGYRLDAGGNR